MSDNRPKASQFKDFVTSGLKEYGLTLHRMEETPSGNAVVWIQAYDSRLGPDHSIQIFIQSDTPEGRDDHVSPIDGSPLKGKRVRPLGLLGIKAAVQQLAAVNEAIVYPLSQRDFIFGRALEVVRRHIETTSGDIAAPYDMALVGAAEYDVELEADQTVLRPGDQGMTRVAG